MHMPGTVNILASLCMWRSQTPNLKTTAYLLTVGLDVTANNSYLLLLDARDWSEIARASAPARAIWLSRCVYPFVTSCLQQALTTRERI